MKELVFEQRKYTFAKLGEILKKDWNGYERDRLAALRLTHKYGNNDAVADTIALEFSDFCARLVNNQPNGRGGVFKAALFSIDECFKVGARTMATPDGRKAGDILSKNLCATVTMDKKGVTGLINSVTKMDLANFATGSVHDGDGIRTTVFFKGCSLKCRWCHNPESLSFASELAFYQEKCVRCGVCAAVCPQNAHSMQDDKHVLIREDCATCGQCEAVCPNEALQLFGKWVTLDKLVEELLEDKDFYDATNGGVTLSGGECLLQAPFCAEVLKRLKENGVHTAVDTCGFVPRIEIDKVLPYTDVFLYDMKAYDESVHIRCTGKSNAVILDNLRYISKRGAVIEIRIPFVPGYNDQEVEKIGNFLREIDGVRKVKLLAYHNLAASKYTALGKENALPTEEQLEQAKNTLRSYGLNVE